MSKQSAQTGFQPTALVAMEQSYKSSIRILTDPYAEQMMPRSIGVFLKCMRIPALRQWIIRTGEHAIPGSWGGILCRKKYIDDRLMESLPNIDAIINLGAGLDTRFLRLNHLYGFHCFKDKPIWELDQYSTITYKKSRIQMLSSVPDQLTLVPIDFDKESIEDSLSAYGYKPANTRTFFILEAVTQYLTQEGIQRLFTSLSLAAPGSLLAFTYVTSDFLHGKDLHGAKKAYQKFVQKEAIWTFGKNTADWPSFLAQYGYQIVEHADAAIMTTRYIRPTGRNLTVMPIEQTLLAVKTTP